MMCNLVLLHGRKHADEWVGGKVGLWWAGALLFVLEIPFCCCRLYTILSDQIWTNQTTLPQHSWRQFTTLTRPPCQNSGASLGFRGGIFVERAPKLQSQPQSLPQTLQNTSDIRNTTRAKKITEDQAQMQKGNVQQLVRLNPSRNFCVSIRIASKTCYRRKYVINRSCSPYPTLKARGIIVSPHPKRMRKAEIILIDSLKSRLQMIV